MHYRLIADGTYSAKKLGKLTFLVGDSVADAMEGGAQFVAKPSPPRWPDRVPTGRPVGRPKKVRPEATTTDSAAQ